MQAMELPLRGLRLRRNRGQRKTGLQADSLLVEWTHSPSWTNGSVGDKEAGDGSDAGFGEVEKFALPTGEVGWT